MTGSPWVHRLATVNSTLDYVHQLAEMGAPDGSVVVADEQTAGRGSRGRPWHSPHGGFWLSLLCRPGGAYGTEVLSLRVGLAMAEVLESLGLRPSLQLKWPNDLMLGDRKLGGILCETRWQGAAPGWIAVGLGVNVLNSLPLDVQASAARLSDVLPALRPDDLLEPIVARLREQLPRGPLLLPEEVEAFRRRDWLHDRKVREPELGVACGIEADGALRIKKADGEVVKVRAGHVVLN